MDSFKQAWIIDDDKVYIYGLKRLIKLVKFSENVQIYYDGYQAVNQILLLKKYKRIEEIPDVILLDINMPVWDGWEFIKHADLKKINKKIILYVVSSSIKSDDLKKAQELEEVTNFVVKPITTDKLKSMMRNAS